MFSSNEQRIHQLLFECLNNHAQALFAPKVETFCFFNKKRQNSRIFCTLTSNWEQGWELSTAGQIKPPKSRAASAWLAKDLSLSVRMKAKSRKDAGWARKRKGRPEGPQTKTKAREGGDDSTEALQVGPKTTSTQMIDLRIQAGETNQQLTANKQTVQDQNKKILEEAAWIEELELQLCLQQTLKEQQRLNLWRYCLLFSAFSDLNHWWDTFNKAQKSD